MYKASPVCFLCHRASLVAQEVPLPDAEDDYDDDDQHGAKLGQIGKQVGAMLGEVGTAKMGPNWAKLGLS